MAKIKRKNLEPVVESAVDETNGETVATIRLVEKRYKMIPVDIQTYENIMRLCSARGFGKRTQGTMVRILVNNELTKLKMPRSEITT